MTPHEVLAAIKKTADISITQMTLLTYVNAGLVTKPSRGGGGRGHGRWSDFQEVTVAETIAAYNMINGKYNDFPITFRLPPAVVYLAKYGACQSYYDDVYINKKYVKNQDVEDSYAENSYIEVNVDNFKIEEMEMLGFWWNEELSIAQGEIDNEKLAIDNGELTYGEITVGRDLGIQLSQYNDDIKKSWFKFTAWAETIWKHEYSKAWSAWKNLE